MRVKIGAGIIVNRLRKGALLLYLLTRIALIFGAGVIVTFRPAHVGVISLDGSST
jgi:hypothetical protein